MPEIAAPLSPAPVARSEPASREPAPAPPPPPPPGSANLDPKDDGEKGPPEALAECDALLAKSGVRFRPGSIPVRTQASGHTCGAPQVVIYEDGPGEAAYNFAPAVTCQMALALARFETVLQEEAESVLGTKVARIHQGGTYACRKMARFSMVSEHASANAIDIRGFSLADGRRITVKRHFGKLDAEPATAEARFLRRVARRLYDENVFSVVLTPYWDKLHADHFHLDQARYRVDAAGPAVP